MTKVTLEHVSKDFGDGPVIRDLSLEVQDREFVVLLGPSGCGKSTLLRLIAGLTEVTAGAVRFDDRLVNDLTPLDRDIAFVFQSYALYPNMTVRRNVSFPLMMRRFKWWYHLPLAGWWPKRRLERMPEVASAVERTAAMLQISDLLDRRPRTLSGGQRQRVALGRAMVREPRAFLMDEPLSNLDAKLRVQMRAELVALHRQMRRTFIYVTHDQTEAMTMGTRIAVMYGGEIQQYGTPREVFERPANVFVAGFVGNPPMSVLDATVDDDSIGIAGRQAGAPARLRRIMRDHRPARGRVKVGLRTAHVTICDGPGPQRWPATAVSVEQLGSETLVGLVLTTDTETVGAEAQVFSQLPGYANLALGDTVHLAFDLEQASFFDADSERRLEPLDDTGPDAAPQHRVSTAD